MSDEARTATQVKKERKEPTTPVRSQVGASPVGPIGIVLITAYLILFSILLLYGVVQFWPPVTPAGEGAAPTSSSATFLFRRFSISDEVRLLLIVALSGALGSLVHALRSLSWYIGNRDLVRSWLARYILLPFVGSTLGLLFYFVIRAGFFSPEATVQQTSPFGFAALAGLVGLFSEQAVLKLKEVAEILLTKPQPGADAKPQEKG
ncbi:MAG: hypothetical protein ACETWR_23190 [Anaerolineae bacterium]